MSKELKGLGVKKVNAWTLQGVGFVFVTAQEGKLEEVRSQLKEITEIARIEYKDELKGTGKTFTALEEAGKVLSYKIS